MQAIKGVYGLGDAPRLWRERFHDWMIEQGFTQSKFDECFYFKKAFPGSSRNKLLVTMHVDDCEVTGEPEDLLRFRKALEKQFGKVREQSGDFRHCGMQYSQSKDLTRLTHSQKEFIDAMTYKAAKTKGVKLNRACTEEETTAFRSMLGGLQWVSHTRADHCAECSRLQGKRQSPTLEDMRDANALLRR